MTAGDSASRAGGRRRLHALTGLRFFAAAAIVLHHLPGTFGIAPGFLGEARPAQGVSMFFVLSGFVLRYAYPHLGTLREVRRFLVARVARVWPLHVLTLLAAVLMRGHAEIWTFLANVFLLQSWIPVGRFFFGYNSVSWSISTEFAFYLCFPVLLLHFRQDWGWKLLAGAALSLVIALYVGGMGIPGFDGNMNTVVIQGFVLANPLARLFEFVLGMTCAQLWLGFDARGGTAVWTLLEAAAIAFLLFNVTLILPGLLPLLPATDPVELWAALIASPALPVAILLPILATGRGHVSRFLGSPVVRFMGDVSFAIYMTHQLLLIPFQRNQFAVLPEPAQIGLYLVMVVLLSVALHVWVERPCQRVIRRRFGGDGTPVRGTGESPSAPDIPPRPPHPAGIPTAAP